MIVYSFNNKMTYLKKNINLIRNSEVITPRIVLLEKYSNVFYNKVLNELINTELFSTEVIPLQNGNILVYQESLKAAHHVMKSPSIVLVRVFILKKILTKYSILSTKNDISINVTFCKQQGVIDTFFVVGQQYSFSKLMFIPSSSKNNLINICIQKDAKNHSKLETENQFVYCSLVEKFPIFRINFNFDYESLIRGKFLHNFNPQKFSIGIGARLTSTMFQHSVSLFRSYVSCYNKGLWDVVTNKDKNLNQRLN